MAHDRYLIISARKLQIPCFVFNRNGYFCTRRRLQLNRPADWYPILKSNCLEDMFIEISTKLPPVYTILLLSCLSRDCWTVYFSMVSAARLQENQQRGWGSLPSLIPLILPFASILASELFSVAPLSSPLLPLFCSCYFPPLNPVELLAFYLLFPSLWFNHLFFHHLHAPWVLLFPIFFLSLPFPYSMAFLGIIIISVTPPNFSLKLRDFAKCTPFSVPMWFGQYPDLLAAQLRMPTSGLIQWPLPDLYKISKQRGLLQSLHKEI